MSKQKSNKFSCLVIGGGTLPIRCGEILSRAGHEICAIVSADPEVKKWAKEKRISHLLPGADLAARINGPFDYLFSVVNEHILREDVLRLARKAAINYHDAPLPKYAGTHATSWALMNGETSHGITWHEITQVVDAGDIFKQRTVEIAADETALTLNTKCYEAAINSFTELVEELSAESAGLRKQNLEERTFFARFKRPPGGGVISWNSPARRLSALVRALNFGNHPNPLGTAKLIVANEFLIVTDLEILEAESKSPAGTINQIGRDFLQISTADQDIILRALTGLDGKHLFVSELVERFNLREGDRLSEMDADAARRLEELYKTSSKHEKYWVEKLSALEPTAPPYTDNASKSDRPEFASVPVPREISAILNNLPLPGEGKTDNLLPAAFVALLARLSGTESFDLGYTDPEIQKEVGGLENLFAVQIPLRVTIDCLQTFPELLKSLAEQSENAKQHSTYAYDAVARFPQLRQLADAAGQPALPVVVAKVKHLEDYKPAAGTELALVIAENETECRWVFDKNRLEAEKIDKLVSHFVILLKGIAANPDGRLAYLPLLSEEEERRLLVEWNETCADYPKERCIHELFEAQAARTPDKTALIFDETRLTYRELNHRANQLARHLQTLGVGPEVLVGVCLERSVEMIVGLLGILKAGGAYVPLDPAYPKERLAHMLEDSQATVIVTQEKLVGELGPEQAKIVCLDSDWKQIAQAPSENPLSPVKSNNLAYVIYTSGSTGKPKGVAIEHRNTSTLLHWAQTVFTIEQLKGVLASTSVCFDLSVFEIFLPLSCGGTIILVENVLHLPTAAAAGEVTLINTVPSAITELLRIKGVPASVETVNLAGEPLKTSLVRQIYELENVTKVFDLYGPSEDTTYSTFTLRDLGRATIGRPISNTQAYILDRYQQIVPVGIPGELYLGGDGLARGYLNRRELTDERFIKNVFREESTARLYKTGDLVRYLPTGEIEYLGRIDNQVKIRGFRIELGEIETRLLSHPDVEEAVVMAREDTPGEKRLAAYYLLNRGTSLKTNDLRDFLKHTLPDYMIPSAFVELDEMPLTPNGKINRKALPPPDSSLSESEREFVAHRDSLEQQLVKIWETLLGVRPIGVQDNFFELGGHSLQAVRMFAEVEETFGKNIPLATLFEAGTIEKLADILRQDGWSAPESSLVPIQPKGTKPPFFCIHAKGGNVLFYRDLARHLGEDQPFYGLQARRLGGRQVGHATVEEMAEFYIKEIQALQPEGPYYIGGSSFGGLAAFEIAQQLCRKGEKVALLALFDTGTPDYPKLLPETNRLRSKVYEMVRRFQHHRDSLLAFNSKERADYILDKLKKIKLQYRRKINNSYKKAVRKFYLKTKGTGSIPKNYIQIEDQIWRAGLKYQPQIYAGKMTLFRASNQPLGIEPDLTLGWKEFVGGEFEIHEVPGHHGSIVAEPYVRVLAEMLTDCLESAGSKEQKRSPGKLEAIKSTKREFAKTASF